MLAVSNAYLSTGHLFICERKNVLFLLSKVTQSHFQGLHGDFERMTNKLFYFVNVLSGIKCQSMIQLLLQHYYCVKACQSLYSSMTCMHSSFLNNGAFISDRRWKQSSHLQVVTEITFSLSQTAAGFIKTWNQWWKITSLKYCTYTSEGAFNNFISISCHLYFLFFLFYYIYLTAIITFQWWSYTHSTWSVYKAWCNASD